MEERYNKITNDKKKTTVSYVPDSDVIKIVQPFHNKEKVGKRNITPVKCGERSAFKSVTRSGRKITSKVSNIIFSPKTHEESEEETEDTVESPDRPSALFGDEDISGNLIVGFHTPRRKDAMANKASESVKKPSGTPKTTQKKDNNSMNLKTPFSLRAQIRKKIVKEVDRLREDGALDDSGSEYSPSESEEDDSDSSSDSDIKPLDEVENYIKNSAPTSVQLPSQRRKRELETNYVITSEEYFEKHCSKALTSDHTLSKLKTPRLAQDELVTLLKSVNPNHQESIKCIDLENRSLFKKWLFTLREGFNILLYGLGSKRNLLNSFHRQYLQNSPVLVVNGFFPGLTLKEILDGIVADLLGIRTVPSTPSEAIALIESVLKSPSTNRIFLIVHNLDGNMLRNEKAQSTLSQLSRIQKLHMLASIDHINCALLWDQNKLSDFNFTWEDVTSFLPYTRETSYESSIMIKRTGSLALSALKNVFQSLTTNSRSIFKLLMKFQLENTNKNLGMHFSELYRSCRDAFIVSSDLALRTQLTEFIDHELVKWRKDTDYLTIPIDTNILKEFQRGINGDEE